MRRLTIVVILIALGTAAHAAEPKPLSAEQGPKWLLARTFPAAEAHQAAAADENFVYAITNTEVARYNRHTGKRVAVSNGEARHLNSGFLADGKLFCAHSNFPLVPEHSEIKVLNLTSMRLSTFKDFGDFGGSLTWAVRRGDHWWCNFARYGTENSNTFLVKFDVQWKEQKRWTYPAAVIDKLGQFSLSGGIWHDDELLVTGHDDPLFFRLRLPGQGTVLELIDTQSVLFTGQGFASDAKTGGLVGINRARRQVVFVVQK